MYPILSNINEPGLGGSYEEFSENFLEICKQHINARQARGFAFLFYRQRDGVDRALNQAQGFQILNESSGEDMTIFYLSNPRVTGEQFDEFNQTFMKALGVEEQAEPPCMVFFRVDKQNIDDVSFVQIDERLKDYMVIEQIRRQVIGAIKIWDAQGNFGALNPVPLMRFGAAMSRFARPF